MSNKDKRMERYRGKINFIIEKLELVPEKKLTLLEQDGVYYRLVVAIEAAMDLIAMILRDLGKEVEDDYTNIEHLLEIKSFSPKLAEDLRKCNGLRNALVHQYNKVDGEIALGSLSEVKNILFKWIEFVEGLMDEFEQEKNSE